MKNAQKLINDVKAKIRNNEYNTVTLKGVRNLSRSDLEMLEFYAETYIRNRGNFRGLMQPLGSVKTVLQKYDLCA